MDKISQDMEIKTLPVKLLHADVEFNCRGEIAPIDVTDLARSMDNQGLQLPIMVQPYLDLGRKGPNGTDYRIVSGYRRHKAAVILGWTEVPCIVRTGLTDVQARILNLGENLNRQDLNILQEARALFSLKIAGLSQEDVSRELNKSRGWVQVRYMLLDLPKEVQAESAAGLLNQEQIRDLYTMRGDIEAQADAINKIKTAREKGEKPVSIKKKPKKTKHAKEHRQRGEIFIMMEHIQNSVGNNFGTRCLAWSSGEISDQELYLEIRELALSLGKSYEIPKEAVSEMSEGSYADSTFA